mgnify:CR=1 FL=1
MRKKIACLLAAALCVTAALGGCSGSGKGSGGMAQKMLYTVFFRWKRRYFYCPFGRGPDVV